MTDRKPGHKEKTSVRAFIIAVLGLGISLQSFADTWAMFSNTSHDEKIVDTVTDGDGAVYVAIVKDGDESRVEKFDPNGNFLKREYLSYDVIVDMEFIDDAANPALALFTEKSSGDENPRVFKLMCDDLSQAWRADVDLDNASTEALAGDLAVSTAGKIFIVGCFKGSITFSGTGSFSSTSGMDGMDVYVAKLDEQGNWLEATKSIRDGLVPFSRGLAISVSDLGVYVAGFIKTHANVYYEFGFGNNTISGTPSSAAGDFRPFTAKFDTSLAPLNIHKVDFGDARPSMQLVSHGSDTYFGFCLPREFRSGVGEYPFGGRNGYVLFGKLRNDGEPNRWQFPAENYLHDTDEQLGVVSDLVIEVPMDPTQTRLWITIAKLQGEATFDGTTYSGAGSLFVSTNENHVQEVVRVQATGSQPYAGDVPWACMALGPEDLTGGDRPYYYSGSQNDADVDIGSESESSSGLFWWLARRGTGAWAERYAVDVSVNDANGLCDLVTFDPPRGRTWYAKNDQVELSASPSQVICNGDTKVLSGWLAGSGDLPSSGSTSSVTISALTQASSLEWQYDDPSADWVGQPLDLPSGVDPLTWELEFVAGNADDFYQSPVTADVFPLHPCQATLRWTLNSSVEEHTVVPAWPQNPLRYVIGSPAVDLGEAPNHQFVDLLYSECNAGTSEDHFSATEVGYSVLQFTDGLSGNPTAEPSLLRVVETVHVAPILAPQDEDVTIGRRIPEPSLHKDQGRSGWVANDQAQFDNSPEIYERNQRTGRIIPVNEDDPDNPDDDLIVVYYDSESAYGLGVAWPVAAVRYHAEWPSSPPTIQVTDELGSEGSGVFFEPDAVQNLGIYHQPDLTQPGFNPNDEHALVLPSRIDSSCSAVYALRYYNPADRDIASKPYVLAKYYHLVKGTWKFTVFKVQWSAGGGTYTAVAGHKVPLPYPLQFLDPCPASFVEADDPAHNPYFKDHRGEIWAICEGTMRLRFQYPLLEDFFYDNDGDLLHDPFGSEACIPWGEGGGLNPEPTEYQVVWPASAPEIKTGQTVTEATNGLPDIINQAAVRVVYDALQTTDPAHTADSYQQTSAVIMDPLSERRVPLASWPESIPVLREGDRLIPTELPYSLRLRFSYDASTHELCFKGVLMDQGAGEKLLLPNVIGVVDEMALTELHTAPSFQDALQALRFKTRNPRDLDVDGDNQPDHDLLVGWQDPDGDGELEPLAALGINAALSAGLSKVPLDEPDGQYLTIVVNDDPSLGALPVELYVFKVLPELYDGEIKVFFPSDNVFEERLAVRHSCDFIGTPCDYEFEWRFTQADTVPGPAQPPGDALDFASVKGLNSRGLAEIVLQGANEITLRDNHFWVRYRRQGVDPWSDWAGASGGGQPQLAPGWVKRVILGINPFESRVRDFHSDPVNTYSSMLTMAGERYEGDIAFNPSAQNLNEVGLIETYETVLRRTMKLSFDNFDPGSPFLFLNDSSIPNYFEDLTVSKCVLFSASRLADLYKLLGDEAYADALDPTIGFTTSSGVAGDMASAMFSFENQVPSMLEEELCLLRGRDDETTSVRVKPLLNRLFWNYTSGQGELAYAQCYGISDLNYDGFIDELDAKTLFPQGHGDAWGHYLTGIKCYYRLLKNPLFAWEPRAEQVLVGGQPVGVDYMDERKFARLAAARARTGADIVSLTYRQHFQEGADEPWSGYHDQDPTRAWGVVDWGRRAGQGAFFDWVMANALIPEEDLAHQGIQKIDRSTVTEIGEISRQYQAIQTKVDEADQLLNPLGLAKGVVPFDINPSLVMHPTAGKTHFEQVYERAVTCLENCIATFDHANEQTRRLRENQDSADDFSGNISDQDADYISRLIELFGYPYDDDMGPGRIYPADYEGPDLYHYNLVDCNELTGSRALPTEEMTAYFKPMEGIGFYPGDESGDSIKQVKYHVSLDGANMVPKDFTGSRQAPGEIQFALSEFLLTRAAYEQALRNYDNLIARIEVLKTDLALKTLINTAEILILNDQLNTVKSLNDQIQSAHFMAQMARESADFSLNLWEGIAETFPKSVGTATDATSGARSCAKLNGAFTALFFDLNAVGYEEWQLSCELAKEEAAMNTAIRLEVLSNQFDVLQRTHEIEELVREEPLLRLELFRQMEMVRQSLGRYQEITARAFRLLDEFIVFRKAAAAETQAYRYRDMTFRTFRNDALQKYRAQFDLAARYAYLAAAAYDYETNLLGSENGAGVQFLTEIVRQRCPGRMSGDEPMVGSHGLADSLATLRLNFEVLKGQLGFNNPQTETNRFSLRQGHFRIQDDDKRWRGVLEKAYVSDLWDIPEFRRYCRPFAPEYEGAQPGLVFEFSSDVTFGHNYFGRPLMGGDSAYDPSHFATRVRSVGVWFSNYDGTGLSQTPRVYLIPVGSDKLRSPSSQDFNIRDWQVVDQRLPEPFPIRQDQLLDPAWIPIHDALNGDLFEIRRHSSLLAHHDDGYFDPGDVTSDSRLIGRSVWNTRWMLIIPGGTLLNDPDDGIETFIDGADGDGDGVSDIKIFFQTYAYSGNRSTGEKTESESGQEVKHD